MAGKRIRSAEKSAGDSWKVKYENSPRRTYELQRVDDNVKQILREKGAGD